MARLFISHSSWNNDKAVEVRDWLAKNGWQDVFLDLDPERGIVAGQRWREALQKAAWRCEVVLALVSKEWLDSFMCRSEVETARLMGKKVIVALVGIDKAQVPPDLTDEQFIDLTGDPDAYRRLKEGLKRAGLDPTSFPFPPDRRPYPGFAYFEEQDAAVYFGRDAQNVRGLDDMRRLARTGVTRMSVILGASGSGKSSFLRAGLWPRLKRDDRAWLPLPIVRPERAAISGAYGLAAALCQIAGDPRFSGGMRQRGLPRSRIDIQDALEKTDDELAKLLAALRDIAQASFAGEDARPPTVLLAIDQGEELFNEEGREEAKRLIDLLTKTLAADPRTMAVLVMRSDAFPLVQSDPALAALPKDTFTLDMMLEGSFRAVIEGPARLVEPPLKIDAQLTDALLEDISGQDALPLLAFTLAHLYDNTRADNALTLDGYEKIGRVEGVIDKTVAQAFAEAVARREAPEETEEQLKLARSAFIPHLAQVNPVNPAGQFARRVAPREKIPEEARSLIDRFAEQRLLIRDRRKDADGKDVDVFEVAHEALLRQPPFAEWLEDDRDFLVWRERLSQARTAFAANQRGLLADRELSIARDYLQTRTEREFEPADLAFIRDSIADDDKRRADEAEEQRKREAAEKEEQERRIRDAERIAEEQTKAAAAQKQVAEEQTKANAAQKRTNRAVQAGLAAALVIAALAGWQYFVANAAKKEAQASAEREKASADQAKANLREAQITQSRYLADQARQRREAGDVGSAALLALEALPDAAAGTPQPYVPEAELQLDVTWRDLRERFLVGHEERVWSAAFSPDGQHIVTASDDKTARVWDAASGKPIGAPLKGHEDVVRSAAFSPDGKRIVTASSDQTARVWDAATGKPIGEPLRGHDGLVYRAAFSPDGQRIVTASSDKTARVWDAESRKPNGDPLGGHEDVVWSAAFSPDGQRIVTASWDRTARVWDAASGKPIAKPLSGHEGEANSAAFSPDGKRIVTASWDKTARVWDAASGKAIGEPLRGHERELTSAAFDPNGKRIVTASNDGKARVWDAASGDPIGEPLEGHEGEVRSAAFSPDGQRIVTASFDLTARVWDAATRKAIGEPLRGHKSVLQSAAFSPDGQRILTASSDGTARVWDAASGKPIGEPLEGHKNTVLSAEFSPDGQRIVTASWDGTARVWDAASRKPIGEFKSHNSLLSAAFSPDGKRIVTASKDWTAQVWDAASGKPIGEPLKGHDGRVYRAAFSADGKRIVTASADNTARVWDAASGKAIGELKGHEGAVASAAFSHDGKRIVTASDDKTARVWDVFPDTQALVSQAKKDVPRCLTRAQRKTFFLSPEPPAWCVEMEKWPYATPVWKRWLAEKPAGKNPPLPP
ncbi:TIR domain-containing protein [uncultured Rhodoblastus sp.]|uniref:nSTAND1 domain-containing NTPase n=1 Tax=uncultured Rhodoblastus sp. TaxID=543037 RepID=UPI0025FA2B60|nr:TIR domain-containing protein [uncultured Rhodoblastus sp.]